MAECRRPVQYFIVDYVCSECRIGLMEVTGKVSNASQQLGPSKYQHRCRHCKALAQLPHSYPRRVAETIE